MSSRWEAIDDLFGFDLPLFMFCLISLRTAHIQYCTYVLNVFSINPKKCLEYAPYFFPRPARVLQQAALLHEAMRRHQIKARV